MAARVAVVAVVVLVVAALNWIYVYFRGRVPARHAVAGVVVDKHVRKSFARLDDPETPGMVYEVTLRTDGGGEENVVIPKSIYFNIRRGSRIAVDLHADVTIVAP